MSTWLFQNLMYGVKVPYTKFEELTAESEEDWDELLAVNSDDGFGWWTDDESAVYGKILVHGEDYGNDTVIGAESGVKELALLSPDMQEAVQTRIKKEITSPLMADEFQYLVVVNYG